MSADYKEKEVLTEELTEGRRRSVYVDLQLVYAVWWAFFGVAMACGMWGAVYLLRWIWNSEYVWLVCLSSACGGGGITWLVRFLLERVWQWLALHPESPWRQRPTSWICERVLPKGEHFYRPLFHLALGLMIVAAVLCGVFWQQCDWLHDGMRVVLASSLGVSVAVILSLCSLLLLFVVLSHSKAGYLWPLLLGPVVFFWLLAGGEHFCWDSLYGVFWCLGAFLLVFLPTLRREGEPERPAHPDTVGRRLLYRRMGSRIRYLVGMSAQKGVTVVVTGPWGSGKSHFINYLAYSLGYLYHPREKDPMMENAYLGRFKVCSVDLWRSKDKEAMWNDIAAALASVISGRTVQLINRWRSLVTELLQALHLPVFSLADAILQLVTTGVDASAAAESVLARRINYPKNAYILVLDNLDRCDREKVEALFPLIERLRRIRGLVTICAIAPDALERRCGHEGHPGFSVAQSLLKVFDVSLPLPKVSVKYTVPFLLRLLTDLKLDCPNLRLWILRQQLRFDTPRQMENIVQQLGLLDNCYLRRWNEGDSERMPDDSLRMKLDAAFYMSALRVVAPSLAGVLERYQHPSSLLQRTLACLNMPPSQSGRAETQRAELVKEWGAGAEEIFRSDLLQSLMEALGRLDEESLSYATEQAYLRMSALTEKESSEVLDCCVREELSPCDALSECFPHEFLPEEESALYWGVLEYALHTSHRTTSMQYVDKCLNQDILLQAGSYRELVHSPELLMHLVYRAFRTSRDGEREAMMWKQWMTEFAEETDAQTLCVVLNEVAGYPQGGADSALLKECCTPMYRFLSQVRRRERRSHLEQDMEMLYPLCSVLFERYACSLSEAVLGPGVEGAPVTAMVWGMKYTRQMVRAVSRYLRDSTGKQLLSKPSWVLVHYLMHAMLLRSKKVDEMVCELPFAVVWWQIFIHLDEKSKKEARNYLLWDSLKELLHERIKASGPVDKDDVEQQLRHESCKAGARYLLVRIERFERRCQPSEQEEEYTETE